MRCLLFPPLLQNAHPRWEGARRMKFVWKGARPVHNTPRAFAAQKLLMGRLSSSLPFSMETISTQ